MHSKKQWSCNTQTIYILTSLIKLLKLTEFKLKFKLILIKANYYLITLVTYACVLYSNQWKKKKTKKKKQKTIN